MRKLTITPLILLLALVLFSCKKESQIFDYDIIGIGNLSTNRCETKTIDVTVKTIEGTPERVTLKMQDVPDGISAAIETPQGLPNSSFTTPYRLLFRRTHLWENTWLRWKQHRLLRLKPLYLKFWLQISYP